MDARKVYPELLPIAYHMDLVYSKNPDVLVERGTAEKVDEMAVVSLLRPHNDVREVASLDLFPHVRYLINETISLQLI